MLNGLLEALKYSKALSMLGSYLQEIKIDSGYQGIPIAKLASNADEPDKKAELKIGAGSYNKDLFSYRSFYPSQSGAKA